MSTVKKGRGCMVNSTETSFQLKGEKKERLKIPCRLTEIETLDSLNIEAREYEGKCKKRERDLELVKGY